MRLAVVLGARLSHVQINLGRPEPEMALYYRLLNASSSSLVAGGVVGAVLYRWWVGG